MGRRFFTMKHKTETIVHPPSVEDRRIGQPDDRELFAERLQIAISNINARPDHEWPSVLRLKIARIALEIALCGTDDDSGIEWQRVYSAFNIAGQNIQGNWIEVHRGTSARDCAIYRLRHWAEPEKHPTVGILGRELSLELDALRQLYIRTLVVPGGLNGQILDLVNDIRAR